MANLQLIKWLCEQKNISIRQLAEQVGLRDQQIHVMVKTGSTKIDTLERIAQALGVPVATFFGEPTPTISQTGSHSVGSVSGNVDNREGVFNYPCPEEQKKIDELEKKIESLTAEIAHRDDLITHLRQSADEQRERISELKERISELKGGAR